MAIFNGRSARAPHIAAREAPGGVVGELLRSLGVLTAEDHRRWADGRLGHMGEGLEGHRVSVGTEVHDVSPCVGARS